MKNYSLPDVAMPIPRAFVLILELESPHIRVSWGYSQIIIWVAHLHQHLFGCDSDTRTTNQQQQY